MQVAELIRCERLACRGVALDRHSVPNGPGNPDSVAIVMVAEAVPPDPAYWLSTVEAFRAAGANVETLADVEALGVYLTTAVKCGKTGYPVTRETIEACSYLLEEELGLFPLARVLLLMGDSAIKAVNVIAERNHEPRPVPAGATYRIRGGDFRFRGMRVFPSYLQVGPAFYGETSKRRMIAEDIAAALAFVR